MTFADTKVRSLLNRRFACTWINTEGDPNAGGSFAHAPGTPAGTCMRGNGEHNIQLVTMTPDGKIFHVLAGYISAPELVDELKFALSTFASLGDESRVPAADRVAAAHRDFLAAYEKQPAKDPLAKRLGEERAGGMMANFRLRRVRDDHNFMIRHPLLPIEAFRPAMLVGNGKTFFGSGAGGRPDETIGEDADDVLDRIRRRVNDNDPGRTR